jgi:RHS repeat-associated protein
MIVSTKAIIFTYSYSVQTASTGRLRDSRGRHTSVTDQNNKTTTYAYDDADRLTSVTDAANNVTTYGYDTESNLTSITDANNHTTDFAYDAYERVTKTTFPSNLSETYGYDADNNLTSKLDRNGNTIDDGASYSLDNAGNRTSKTDWLANVTSNYAYDQIYELTQVTQGTNTTESYTYDPVDNRLTSVGVASYSYNSENELTSTSNATYAYDNNGNMLTKTDSTGTTTYAWDFENQLTSVTLPGNGGTVSFKYDPFGKRIYKQSSLGTSIFGYDGENLIEEVSSTGAVIARYSMGLKLDEPFAELRGTTSYYEADGLGSISSLSNSAGGLTQTYTFDSFGKQTASSGSLTNPFRYTAREFDVETNLYFYRARYYDPSTGRFISEDPIRFGPNVYTYVRNRPLVLRDPLGLKPSNDDCLKQAVAGWTECLLVGGGVTGVGEATCLAACMLTGPGFPECAYMCTEIFGGIEDKAILICTAAAVAEYYECKNHGHCNK